MAEIIYPSQVLAEIDWENPLAQELVSNGVGIFYTDDNLITVTNLVTDVAGTPTDVTNNELGEEVNGIRMGADISVLSAASQADVSANPYQLLKRKEDLQDEYCLALGDVTHTVTFPLVGAWTGEITYSDGTTSLESGTDSFALDGTTSINITKFTATDSTQDYFWEFNQTKGEYVKCHYTGELAILSGFGVDSGYVRGEDGAIVGYQFDGDNLRATPSNLWVVDAAQDWWCEVDLISGSDITSDQFVAGQENKSTSKNWKLFINDGNIGILHHSDWSTGGWFIAPIAANTRYLARITYSGGTLSFHLNGEPIGSEPRTATKTIALQYIGGNGTEQNTYAIVISAECRDLAITGNDRFYDGTTGNNAYLVDTISGKHALFAGASYTKWQSVLEKQTFTVGTGWSGADYADITAFAQAQNGDLTKVKEALLKGECKSETASTSIKYLTANFILRGTVQFTGNNSEQLPTVTDATFEIGALGEGSEVLVQDLALVDVENTNTTRLFSADISENAQVTGERLYINASNPLDKSGVFLTGNAAALNGQITVKNSTILGGTSAQYYPLVNNHKTNDTGSALKLLDCVILAKGEAITNISAVNCLISSESNNANISKVQLYNEGSSGNLFNLVQAPPSEVGEQDLNVLTYFTDIPNNDYTINSAGQTALEGKGWNGSNIAEWLYADLGGGEPADPVTPDFMGIFTQPSLITVSFEQIATPLLSDVTAQPSIDGISFSIISAPEFSGISAQPVIDNISFGSIVAPEFTELITQPTIDSIVFTAISSVSFLNVSAQPVINTISFEALASPSFSEITTQPTIDKCQFYTKQMPALDGGSLLLIDNSVSYKLIDNTINYRIM